MPTARLVFALLLALAAHEAAGNVDDCWTLAQPIVVSLSGAPETGNLATNPASSQYIDGTTCSWTLQSASSSTLLIQYQVVALDLEPCCDHFFVAGSEVFANSEGTVCASELQFFFTSDVSVRGAGVVVQWTVLGSCSVPPPPVNPPPPFANCWTLTQPIVQSGRGGELRSNAVGTKYESSVNCQWRLKPVRSFNASAVAVDLTVVSMTLESTGSDTVRLTAASVEGEKFPQSTVLLGRVVATKYRLCGAGVVELVTDGSVEEAGLHAVWDAVQLDTVCENDFVGQTVIGPPPPAPPPTDLGPAMPSAHRLRTLWNLLPISSFVGLLLIVYFFRVGDARVRFRHRTAQPIVSFADVLKTGHLSPENQKAVAAMLEADDGIDESDALSNVFETSATATSAE